MIDVAMDVWNSPGVPSDYGCAQNALLRWIDYANGMHTGKRVVAVEHWMWLDLAFPESCQEDFESHFRMKGKQPAFLKANKVITDSSGEFEPGFFVRTTALVRLHESCIFETRNSLYILAGSGTRKQIPLEIALAFFF